MIMKRKMLIILLFFPLALWAQEEEDEHYRREYSKFRLGFEAGVGFLYGQTVTPTNVRENQSYYYDPHHYDRNYYCGYVSDYYSVPHYYIGVKSEISLNTSISLATGLRFLGSNSELNSDRQYFLWKVAENNLTTDYVRVKHLTQNNLYVGIPLEMMLFTYKRDIMCRHFLKGGVNFNFLLASKTTPYFENEAMNKYAIQIVNEIEKNTFFAPIGFIGTGLKFGRMNRPFGTVEIRMPFGLKENASFSSFIKTSVGIELQTSMYLPLGNKKVYTKKH